MAHWPELTEFKQRLDVDSNDWDGEATSGSEDDETGLSRLLAAAIAETKARIGAWVEDTDIPTDAQAQSALELACEYALKTPDPGRRVPRSVQLLQGSRRRFGTA